MLKKLLLAFFSINLLFATLLTPVAHAQATWYNPSFSEFQTRVMNPNNPDEIFGERYTYAQVVWVFYSLSSILIPDQIESCVAAQSGSPQDMAQCLGDAVQTIISVAPPHINNSSLAGTLNEVITNRPSGVGYLANTIGTKLNLVPEAKAQGAGFGFQTLEPIRQIWANIRNISYFLMVFAFVVMAFLIMFRMKTSPQTVITVQSALPKLIIILILITFSYAISGFLIDLAYIVLGLFSIAATLPGSQISNLTSLELFQQLLGAHPILAMFFTIFAYVLIGLTIGALASLIPGVGWLLVFLQAIIFLVILLMFVLIWVRIVWLMFKTFINIILLIIASPILLLLGVFPAGGGFGTWARNLISHIAVYPTIIIMFFIAHFLFWSSLDPDGPIGSILNAIPGLNPYDIVLAGGAGGSIQFPGFLLGSPEIFGFVAAIGVLFLVPSVGNIIQSFISGKPFGYGSAIGETFAIPMFVGRGAASGAVVYGLESATAKGRFGMFLERVTGGVSRTPIVQRGMKAVEERARRGL